MTSETDEKSYMNAFGSTKMGRVTIAVETISEHPDAAQAIMAQMVPIHSIYVRDRESMLYLAISEHFDELDAKEDIVPLYLTHVYNDGSIKFVRQDYKKRIKESTREQIVHAMVDNDVNMEEFKSWVRNTQNASDDDFKELNEDFLEILNLYINRR